jgi:hypothetical protein
MRKFLLAFTYLALITSCNTSKNINSSKNEKFKFMYELAIYQSKESQYQTFLNTREKFVEVLDKEKVLLNKGEWKPFYTFVPGIELDNVLIGMTQWNSLNEFSETSSRLSSSKEARDYFSSFNSLAFVFLEPLDGKAFDFEALKNEGLALEFVIRRGKTKDAFGEKTEILFNSLDKYDGYKFSREFKVYKMNEQGVPSLVENTQAVIIVWENVEKFQSASQSISVSKEFQEYVANLEVETFFAASPTR